jgi:hypothetical protein
MLDVQKMVAISGKSGVFKLIAVRSNGLIIEDYDTKKREFAPVRQTEFSPFETITIYTDAENITLAQVLTNMKAQADGGNTPPSEKSPSDELRDYFISVQPDHDRDRVHISDIKKMIKWFNFLNSRNLLKEKVEEVVAEETKTENTEG